MTPRKFVFLSALLIPAAALPSAVPRVPGDAEFGGKRVFYLHGSAYSRGLRHGRLLREEILYLRKTYEQAFFNLLGGNLGRKFLATRALKLSVPPELREEMAGIAQGCGLSYEEVLLANTFFDLVKMFACTTVVSVGKNGFFARNLDFPGFGVLHRHTVIFSVPGEKERRVAIIGFPGLVGALSGINSDGLAAAVMEVYGKKYNLRAEPYAMAFRRMLESCSDLSAARRFLKETPTTTGNNLTVCDASGRAGVFEITPNAVRLRTETEGRYLYATNHFLSENPGGTRIEKIRKLIASDPPPTLRLAERLLRATVTPMDNLQAMIFFPSLKALALSCGKLPAAEGPYTRLGAPMLGFGLVSGRRRLLLFGGTERLAESLRRFARVSPGRFLRTSSPSAAERFLKETSPHDILFLAAAEPFSFNHPAVSTATSALAERPVFTIAIGRGGKGAKLPFSAAVSFLFSCKEKRKSLQEAISCLLEETAQEAALRGKITLHDLFTLLSEKLSRRKIRVSYRGSEAAKTISAAENR